MKKIQIGDKEFEVPDEVERHYRDMAKKVESYNDLDDQLEDALADVDTDSLEEDMGDLPGTDTEELDEEMDDLGIDNQDLVDHIDELEDELADYEEEEEEDEYNQDVQDHVFARDIAQTVLRGDALDYLDDMTLDELKEAVILTVSPDVDESKLDDGDYCDARFDAIAEDVCKNDYYNNSLGEAILNGRQDRLDSNGDEITADSVVSNADEARAASIARDEDYMNKRMEEMQA